MFKRVERHTTLSTITAFHPRRWNVSESNDVLVPVYSQFWGVSENVSGSDETIVYWRRRGS